MKRAISIVGLLLLAFTCWRVYAIRGRLAAGDSDPEQLALLKGRLDRLTNTTGDGEYRGSPYDLDVRTIRAGGADAYGSVQFLDRNGGSYRVYVGGAVANAENFHTPSYCMPSAGWEVVENRAEPIVGLPRVAEGAEMRRMALQLGNQRMLVYYWFQAGSRTTDDEFMVRAFRFMDLLMGKPFRPTMIVTIYTVVHDDFASADRRARKFLTALGPRLMEALDGKENES